MKGLLQQEPRRLLDAGNEHERRLLASAGRDRVPGAAAARVAAALGDVLAEPSDAELRAEELRAEELRTEELRADGHGAEPSGQRAESAGASGLLQSVSERGDTVLDTLQLGAKRLGAKPLALAGLGGAVLALLAFGMLSAGRRAAPAWQRPIASSAAVESERSAAPKPPALSPAAFLMPATADPLLQPLSAPLPAPGSASPERAPRREAPATPSTRVRRGPERAADAARGSGTLLEEVRALDSIRGAVRAGDARAAARRLARYRRRYPQGELRLESEVLAVDLALAEGRHEDAVALAQELLVRPGSQRYAQHLLGVLKGSKATPAHINGQEMNHQ